MADVSSEVLHKLAELIKATGSNTPYGSTPLDYLKGATDFIGVIASWPVAVVFCVFLFRRELATFIGDVDTVWLFGAKAKRKISAQVEQSAKETQETQEAQDNTGVNSSPSEGELSRSPSEGELSRARIVENLAASTDIAVIRRQAEDLATEYQKVRASMLPGNKRTRAMEVVVSKMRTIGQAFFPIRHEFINSPSPGQRLMVIAALQVHPDFDLLDWLADRAGSEKPFLQSHSLIAILVAVGNRDAKSYLQVIEGAVDKVRPLRTVFGSDTSRTRILDEIEKSLKSLKT
jgi:hypothetical protein